MCPITSLNSFVATSLGPDNTRFHIRNTGSSVSVTHRDNNNLNWLLRRCIPPIWCVTGDDFESLIMAQKNEFTEFV